MKYKNELNQLLSAVPFIRIEADIDAATKRAQVDNYLSKIHQAMIEAARKSDIIPRKMNHPKKYWCPDLTRARDTKRFWWLLWNGTGRPRRGEVFNCYKHVKKTVQKVVTAMHL